MRLPVVFQRKTSFRDFDSAEAQMLPNSAKAASQQYSALATIMQQLDDATKNWSLPKSKRSMLHERKIFYPLKRCGTFVARPEIERSPETVSCVIRYCTKLDGEQASRQLEIPFPHIDVVFDHPDLPTPQ